MRKKSQEALSLREIVGGGYNEFWRFQGRYRVVKGSRNSKKSTTTAINFIVKLMKHPGSNLLVIRRTFRTLKDSCYAQLKWAIRRCGVDAYWKCRTSPLEMEYLPTGQKIYFRGLDDPLKITSITVDVGALCWFWIEEAYEISDETSFNTLDESLRGEIDADLYKQITLTFNPWTEKHWLKGRFFDVNDPDILALTTNYLCNEWVDAADLRLFETMKLQNPKRYEVAGLGNWGIEDGTIFDRNWLTKRYKQLPSGCTLIQTWDLAFKDTDASAKCAGLVLARKGAEIYIVDCINEKMSFTRSASEIKNLAVKYPQARAKVIEDKANGPAIIDYLKKEVSGLIPFTPKGSKESRALAVTPYFEAGNVYFPVDKKWAVTLIDDLAEFPMGLYKDTVDALVQGILYMFEKTSHDLGGSDLSKESYFRK